MLRSFFWAIPLGVLFVACSSPVPSSSSSSHWLECHDFDDCRNHPEAVACVSGYCVRADGQRLSASSREIDLGSSRPLSGSDAASSARSSHVGSDAGAPCDPLAPHELPVALGTILGVGRDADGVTYLADEVTPSPSTSNRVFVSRGTTLFRKLVTGSSIGGNAVDGSYSFAFEGDSGPLRLYIDHTGGQTSAMKLGRSGVTISMGDPKNDATPLTVLDPLVLFGFALRNLPGDVAIEFIADVSDGNIMLVTHPAYGYTDADFRLFFGPPTAVLERYVVKRTLAPDGLRHMVFDVDGTDYEVQYGNVLTLPEPDAGDGGNVVSHPGPGILDEGGGAALRVTPRWPAPTTLSGFRFTCL